EWCLYFAPAVQLTSLLSARIVGGIDVLDCRWPYRLHLNRGSFPAGPDIMRVPYRHAVERAGLHHLSFAGIDLVALGDENRAGKDGDHLHIGMRVRRNAIIRRPLGANDEHLGLAWVTGNDGGLSAFGKGRVILPDQRIGIDSDRLHPILGPCARR